MSGAIVRGMVCKKQVSGTRWDIPWLQRVLEL